MQLLLSNTGRRWALHQAKSLEPGQVPHDLDPSLWILLLELSRNKVVPFPCEAGVGVLLERGLVEVSDKSVGEAALELRAKRDPLEHVNRVAIEFTTACGFSCLHCRNAAQAPVAEESPARLFPAVDLLAEMGIRRFDFIGGEVTQFGTGWLDVVRYIRERPGTTATTLTSGWFLDREDFMAGGKRYGKDLDLLEDLARHGVTHLAFSLDGPEEVHDRWRRAPGLYQRVLAGMAKARQVGLKPQVSFIGETRPWLVEAARALYPEAVQETPRTLLRRLALDEQNYRSNLVDVGGAAALRKGRIRLRAIKGEDLPCRGFFRPGPSLRINANGEVATCPLMGDAPGFGNLREKSLAHILNHMHETPLFRLHAEKRIAGYRRFLDPGFFSGGVDHVCAVRVAVNRIALIMLERGVDPEDAAAVRSVNEEVVLKMGERLTSSQTAGCQ